MTPDKIKLDLKSHERFIKNDQLAHERKADEFQRLLILLILTALFITVIILIA